MAKADMTNYQHQLENGKIFTRESKRPGYTHVAIVDTDREVSVANRMVGPGPVVIGWYSSAKAQGAQKFLGTNFRVEPINHGTRPAPAA